MNVNKTTRLSVRPARDGALRAYAALKRGQAAIAASYVTDAAARLSNGDNRALDMAFWLWIAGEYVNYGGEPALVAALSERIESGIALIDGSWREPDAHWLWEEEEGVFLSHLALYYGALRSIGNIVRSDTAQRACKEIREKTFAAFMSGKHFVSREGSADVWGDIVAASAPFGLLSVGDLAMLDALTKLDEERLSPEAAALLASYYAESGHAAKARQWLARAGQIVGSEDDGNPEASFLLLARETLASRGIEGAGASPEDDPIAQGIRFSHDPIGADSPYRDEPNGRSPRTVVSGDIVAVRVFAEPFDPDALVMLQYECDDAAALVPMRASLAEDGQSCRQAEIGPFAARGTVRYRFTAGGVPSSISDWYAFDVHDWTELRPVADAVRAEDNEAYIRYGATTPGTAETRLTVTRFADGSASYSLALSAGAEDAERARAARLPDDLPRLRALTAKDGTIRKLRLDFPLAPDERLYGMGERFSRLQFRGCEVDHYVFNQYKDQGNRTYMPVPFLISSAGYGLYLQSSYYSIFRCGSADPDRLQIEADVRLERQPLDWRLFSGKPADVLRQYTDVAGKPKLPPKWAFGPWMSSNNWDSEREVDEQLSSTVRHRIPSTVMVLEQWSDESTFYIFNDANYETKAGEDRFVYDDFSFPSWGRWPDPRAMVRRIHDLGIKVLLWQAPVMKFMDGIAHAQRDEDERYMVTSGFGPLNADGTPYRIPQFEWFRGSMVPDFTNERAAAWWMSKRQYLLDELGIDGFKTDGGECIYGGANASFHDGRTGEEMRNEYPNVYIRAFHEFADARVPGGAVTFSRAGYAGSQALPLHWAGDEKSTFEAFRASIVAGLSCGMSGIPFWGWDLGGFSGEIPTAELFVRSAQMAAFSPVMQYHAESKGQFNLDRTPWNIAERTGSPEALTLYKRFADIRMNLLPYIYEQAGISAGTGIPLMRAMALAYPDDPRCAELATQYLFGDALLAAPVTEEGATETEVYFPAGSWLPLFGDGRPVTGGKSALVPSELATIPVFLRENGVVPMNLGAGFALGDDVGNRVDGYERLAMLVYVTTELVYRFEDDLGNAAAIAVRKDGGSVHARVEVAGDYSVTLRLGALGEATSVLMNGAPLIRASELNGLNAGQWVQRSGEVLVTLPAGQASTILVALAQE
ncbi:TIM-barrel domain-containing protein [Cohnella sp. GCM10027633]|uniref:glycoside hydrolase family 31 protein n=1 Tax=unclassified Cohnella TaxID=2636738 RepID=UPI00363661C6